MRRFCLVAVLGAAMVGCAAEPASRVVAAASPVAPMPHREDPPAETAAPPATGDVLPAEHADQATPAADPAPPEVAPPPVPPPLACILRYYKATARYENGAWFLVLPNGTRVPYDHRRIKAPDGYYWPNVTDIYVQHYPTGPIHPITQVDFDPGAMRLDPLFYATYGSTAEQVRSKLVRVRLGGKVFLVHRRIVAPMRRVAARIAAAIRKDPRLVRFFRSPGGTFVWRHIAGTDALSSHGWGIAIDLDTKLADYWRYQTTNPDGLIQWKNRYPQAIVDAFEAEGFIWGGRWYHFDTMHFEYRPELLDPKCYPR